MVLRVQLPVVLKDIMTAEVVAPLTAKASLRLPHWQDVLVRVVAMISVTVTTFLMLGEVVMRVV
jgi:hypothetical protein